MNRKARRAAQSQGKAPQGVSPQGKTRPGALQAHLAQAVEALRRGQGQAAQAIAAQIAAQAPDWAEAHYILGSALLMQGLAPQAVPALARAAELAPTFPEARNNLGLALERVGRLSEAAECYAQAVALRADYPEAHNNLGNALLAGGRRDEAIAAFTRALALQPRNAEARFNLGNALAASGRPGEAVAAFQQALAERQHFPEALNNLSCQLLDAGRIADAIDAARKAVEQGPNMPQSHLNLANALKSCGRNDEAVPHYRRAIALQPSDADAYSALATLLHERGDADEAEARTLFLRAHQLRPLEKHPAAIQPARFKVLLIAAPGCANTPTGYVAGRADYDMCFYGLMPEIAPDIARLQAQADVVVNLISDVDRGAAILPLAAQVMDRLGKPVINPPARIMPTRREDIARALSGIPACHVPKTVRIASLQSGRDDLDAALADFRFPLLVRRAGAHGGDDFEKLEDAQALRAFIARNPADEHYLTQFAAYRSPDGHWRKYRLIYVDRAIYPYHLAIGDDWKVHHFRTRMADTPWMRSEELAFLEDPATVFQPRHREALQRIGEIVGLDYFGIDCAIDEAGGLLVFEVNATMLVHDEKGLFADKNPHIARIKEAFDRMLRARAGA